MKRKIIISICVVIAFFTIGYSTSPYRINSGRRASWNNVKKNVVINDEGYRNEWDIKYTQSDKAWQIVNQKREITVAVVDSGIDYNSLDLKNRVLVNRGYNFLDNTSNTMDDYGHGTEVAGIIAAEAGNSKGVTGIVGPLDVKLIPIKVLDSNGEGDSDVVANGIVYAADQGADIINVSIDFDTHDDNIRSAISYAKNKGSLVVVAAGNTNSNCDLYSPSGDNGAYTVAAMNTAYHKSYFSSYGKSVQVTAPGEDILTTEVGGTYDTDSGTSMSTPVVSGIAAMVKAERPSLGPDAIARIISTTATDILAKGKDKQSGYGLVNAYRAVQLAKKRP